MDTSDTTFSSSKSPKRANNSAPGTCPPELLTAVYDRLRSIAQSKMSTERKEHTLQATALVHEAFLKLAANPDLRWTGPRQFYGAAAESMRRILIDHARHRNSQKRGGKELHFQLDQNDIGISAELNSLEELQFALDELNKRDSRMHEIVMLRYFAGQNVEQTAELMELSPRTVKREWSVARAWLRTKLNGGNHGS
jgi:RNA polymerase sigma-70 factor (ECF subfamily)